MVVDDIRNNIEAAPYGTLLFNSSYPEYDEEYVGKVLSDLVRQGVLCRLSRGIYLKAKHTKFGLVYPTTEEIARAIAERDNAEILPTGSTALNMLGLSDQVTMTPVFLTSGSARKISCGNKVISFKHGVPRNFVVKGKMTRLLVQAMKAIGESGFNTDWQNAIKKVVCRYPEFDTIQQDLKVMPAWIRRELSKIFKYVQNEQLAEA